MENKPIFFSPPFNPEGALFIERLETPRAFKRLTDIPPVGELYVELAKNSDNVISIGIPKIDDWGPTFRAIERLFTEKEGASI